MAEDGGGRKKQDEEEAEFVYVKSSRRKGRANAAVSNTSKTRAKIETQRNLAREETEPQKSQSKGGALSLPSDEQLQRMRNCVERHRKTLTEGVFGARVKECSQEFTQLLLATGDAAGSDDKSPPCGLPRVLPRAIVALGMGAVSSNRTAQIQLAFLLELRRVLLQGEETTAEITVQAYDPISTPADTALLSSYAISSTDPDTAARGPLTAPTLLYMPHCPRPLYDAYLTASFTRDHLPNLVFCANRLERYEEFLSADTVARTMPAVWRVVPLLRSVAVPVDPDGALSDLAFQIVDLGKQQQETTTSQAPTRSKRGKSAAASAASAASARPHRPTPSEDDFWTLPTREASEADEEVV